jgi:archaellum component FlaC
MAKEFCWNTYYARKTKRVATIDIRLERISKEAKRLQKEYQRLMTEKVALVSEGFPDG